MHDGRRKATSFEVECAKVLRKISGRAKSSKDNKWMQNIYFDICDNGVEDSILHKMRAMMQIYGGHKARSMAKGLQVEIPESANEFPVYGNIYTAVCNIYNNRYAISGKKYMSTEDVKKVLRKVCHEMGVDYTYATQKHRYPPVVKCKYITAYLCRDRAQLKKVANVLGLKDHTSVIHYHRNFNEKILNDAEAARVYNKVKIEIGL